MIELSLSIHVFGEKYRELEALLDNAASEPIVMIDIL